MKNYIEAVYQAEEKEKPLGEYPLQLTEYLIKRYNLKKDMKILDNGCGRGEYLRAFSKYGLKVYGTDISDFCKDAKIVDLNNEVLPFPDNYFDVVFSKSVIEHINNTEHYISEMHRVLKDGGVLILMVPDWETQYLIFYRDPTHIHPYTQKSVEWLLKIYGFKNVKSEKFIQLPQVWNNKIMYMISSLVRKAGPVKKIHSNKFIRFSRELMILGTGRK